MGLKVKLDLTAINVTEYTRFAKINPSNQQYKKGKALR